MSPLAATNLIYLAVAGPLVVAAVWSMYRHVALPLFEVLDADEMLVAAVHRLGTAAHLLVASAFAVVLTPGPRAVTWPMDALFDAWGMLLFLLAAIHLGVLGTFAVLRRNRLQRDLPMRATPARMVPPMPMASLPQPFPVQRPFPMQQQPFPRQQPFPGQQPQPAMAPPVPPMPLPAFMPPVPTMPPLPSNAQPAYAARPTPPGIQPNGAQPLGAQPNGAQPFGAQPFGAQPFGPLPRNPWAPPFR